MEVVDRKRSGNQENSSRKRKHSENGKSKKKHERERAKKSRSGSRKKKSKSGKSDLKSRSRHHRDSSSARSDVSDDSSASVSGGASSDDDSSSGSDDGQLPQAVKQSLRRKEEEKVRRKREKEKMKAYETPEEKRARRLAKKEEKERKKRQKLGWDEEHIAYTASDNPFGDPHLLSKFVWKKKDEVDRKRGDKPCGSGDSVQDSNPINAIMELEKVKRRRVERERERSLRQEAVVAERREREKMYFAEWESQEDSFHLSQAKLRSTIRIQDGRAKPIDLLAKYVSSAEADQQLVVVEMHDPQKFIQGLKMRDLEDLLEDIKVYMELEQGRNAEYWRDITTVVHDEISRLLQHNSGGDDSAAAADSQDRRGCLNANVASEVNKVFAGKTERELIKLKSSIEKKLQTQTNIDTNYWESLLKKLVGHIARVRLQERHKETLRQKLFKLKHEQGVEQTKALFPVEKKEEPSEGIEPPNPPQPTDEKLQQGPSSTSASTVAESSANSDSSSSSSAVKQQSTMEEATDEEGNAAADGGSEEVYDASRYSPRLLQPSELPADAIFLDPEQETHKLHFARDKFLGTGNADIDADRQLMHKVKEGMVDDAADDDEFVNEHTLLNREYLWADKYRPRKPRYFNRVHTGYEWNKYNQTHYDPENPPPKIVQGYKFNIFYPDLIDKRHTPRYTLQPIENEPDFVVLKFSSGPPYEDIAFKIVNREWEYGHKHGYKCQFSNDIFQLWFKFKIYKYRR